LAEDGDLGKRRMCTSFMEVELMGRAFSSFPDTSLFAEGSIMFSFKIRSIPPDPSTLFLPEPPSPMPDQVRSMEQAMTEAAISNERHSSGNQARSRGTSTSSGQSGGGKAEEYRKWDERGREWLYGYVWFEQRKDGGITRGYMQVLSCVLLFFHSDRFRNHW
jgi:hypothetical protein